MNTRIFNTSLKNETAGLLGISAQLLAAESIPPALSSQTHSQLCGARLPQTQLELQSLSLELLMT